MPRKAKEFDVEIFKKLCSLQCTRDEICYFFETTDKTLNAWCKRQFKKPFLDAYAEFRQGGLISLRRRQFELAKHSVPMAIFLGKNYLGQTDKKESTVKVGDCTAEALNAIAAQLDDNDADNTK